MSQRPRDWGRKHYVAVKRGLKLKKVEAQKERCVGPEFSRTTIDNPKKALEEPHHSDSCFSCTSTHFKLYLGRQTLLLHDEVQWVGMPGTNSPKRDHLQSQQTFSPKTKVMRHNFLSFTGQVHCQPVKRGRSSMANALGMVK